jgi:hypothetical protein
MKRCPITLFVVTVAGRDDTWEWQVRAGDRLLISGTEATRLAARLAGNDARFLKGWSLMTPSSAPLAGFC